MGQAAAGADGALRLRPMTEADLPLVAALEAELFGMEAWSAALLADELAATDGPGTDRAYVLVEQVIDASEPGPTLLGYAGLWYGDGRGDADLLTIATTPAARRRGVATRLLGHLLAEARRQGCEHVLLEVRASNTGAQALYSRHGFEVLGMRRRYYTRPDEDALVMRLRLGPERGPGPVGAEAVAAR